MKKSFKVSVVIPSYNHAQFIKKTINSILRQTLESFEIIIIDDCSTDNSLSEINSIKDKRIKKFFLPENYGTVESINLGISKASGEYVAVVGSDDIWEKDKLEKQVRVLEDDKNIGACFSWANVIDENDQVQQLCSSINPDIFIQKNRAQSRWLRYFFENANCLCHSSSLIRKKVYDSLGIYNLAYRQLHDFEYWIRIINKYKIFIIQEPLVKYRRIEKSNISVSGMTLENTVRVFNETYNIWLDYFSSYISDEIFIEAFKDKLKKKDNLSSEELICEKFFILRDLNVGGVTCKGLALRFLAERLNDNVLDCLKNEYNFNLKDFYEESGKEILFYPETITGRNLLDKINNFNSVNQKNKNLIKQYESTINEIYSSTSWKITAPLRKISKIFIGKAN